MAQDGEIQPDGNDGGVSLDRLLGRNRDRVLPLPRKTEAQLYCYKDLRSMVSEGLTRPIRVVANVPDQGLATRVDAATDALVRAKPDNSPAGLDAIDIDFPASSLEQVRWTLQAEIGGVSGHRDHLTKLDAQISRLSLVGSALASLESRRDAVTDLAAHAGMANAWPSYEDSLILAFEPSRCRISLIAMWFYDMRRKLVVQFEALAFYQDAVSLFQSVDRRIPSVRPLTSEDYAAFCSGKTDEFVDGVDCGRVGTRWLLPYYSGYEGAVKNWRTTGTVAAETASFFAAAVRSKTAVDMSHASFALSRHQHAEEILPALRKLHQQLESEKNGLAALRTNLDAEIGALRALQTDIDAGHATAANLERRLSEERTIADTAASDLKANSDLIVSNRAAVELARDDLAKLKEAFQELRLQCGGLPYAQCADIQAKETYNKARYEMYGALADARDKVLKAQDVLMDAIDKREVLLDQKMDALTAMADASTTLATLSLQLDAKEKTYRDRSIVLAGQELRYAGLKERHDIDYDLISTTLKLAETNGMVR
ncbi:hypothetical protein X758_11965 [Mesorhizobium sp. LSHC416B00]|nr:hypothetical protein X761_12635 [Mesorhizobium sp. LSHC424B00]ESX73091.1 hypothetical protein X758_11965 [Mesorhizobium sp. LSHC416B00]